MWGVNPYMTKKQAAKQEMATVEVAPEKVDAGAQPVVVKEPTVVLAWQDAERQVLSRILDLCESIGLGEVHFHKENGLSIRQMDPSRVCMIDAHISLGQTQLGDEQVKRHFVIGIKGLKNAMKLKEPVITVGEASATIRGTIGDSTKTAEVTLPLLEEEEEALPDPKIKYTASAEVDFSDIEKAIAILTAKPEAIKFEIEKDSLVVKGATDEGQSLTIEGMKAEGHGHAVYALSYLAALKDTWKLSLATDMPMKASKTEYAGSGDKKAQCATVTLHIAPRIEVA